MRRRSIFGLIVLTACVAAWAAEVATGQVADGGTAGTPGEDREIVVETIGEDGARRQTRRIERTPDPNMVTSYVLQQSGYVPVQMHVAEADDELQKLKRQDAELVRRSQSLVKKLAETEADAERGPLVNQLDETINKQFDVQQQIREVEVSRIEVKVKKLRETIIKRAGARAAIVRNRREQLLQEADGLGWNSPDASPTGGYPPGVVVRPLPAISSPRPVNSP